MYSMEFENKLSNNKIEIKTKEDLTQYITELIGDVVDCEIKDNTIYYKDGSKTSLKFIIN